jgi:hypothetical protein
MALSSITSGLNTAANQIGSLSTDSTSTATTLPSWYTAAQQNLVNNAITNSANVPQLQNTVAGNAINQLNGPNNPFTNAQSTLQTISSGAANPWITNADGSITPNTNTALGGLAASEQQMLNTTLPGIGAQAGAGGTATGQFGSLRGQTAQQQAYANALAAMNKDLNQAALTNQATGANAASAESQSGAQGTAAETTLGQAQQASPLTSTANLASILGTVQAPTTVTNTSNLSPLSVLRQGQSLLSSMGAAGGLGKIATNFGNLLSSALNGNSPSTSSINNNNGTANDYIPGYGTAPTNPDALPVGATQDPNGQYNNIDYTQI